MFYRYLIVCILICEIGYSQTSVNTEQNVITGITDVRIFERNLGYRWFKDNYFGYQINLSAINALKQMPKDIQFIVFAGTWCETSRQLIPQFFKVMDLAGVQRQRITLCFLDRDKRSAQGFENNYNINNTPVFIILQKGSEIGRITETISRSIEADIADLIPQKQ